MLRGVGRVHSQHHRVPSLHALRPSCALSALQALAPSTTHAPLTHVRRVSPMSPPPRPWSPPEHPGQFPSEIIHAIDAFSSATREDVPSVVSHISASLALRRYIRQRESARRLAQFFASTSRPSRARSVVALAHALGCRFKPNHFESVVYQLSLKGHWSVIPPLVSLARDQCGKTTARLLNWKIRAFIECHRFGRLGHVLEEFARDNVAPSRRTFHLLVSGHLRNQDLDSAKRYLLLMESAGFPVDPSTHALIVTTYRSLGLDPQVHARAFEALCHVDVRTSTRILNSIIQHHLDVGDEPSAAKHIDRMIASPTSRREPDRHPGGTTTNVDGVMSPPVDSVSRTPVIRPDPATFTMLINYLNGQRQFHRVHKLLVRMHDTGVKPDAGVVAALIRTCSLSGHNDMAMGLLAAMLGSDADVLALLCLKAVPQLPVNVTGIALSVHVFNAALPRIMEIRGLGGARDIFRVMRSKGVQPNAATVEVFLNCLERVEHIQTRQLTQVLRGMSRKLHGPTIRHLNIILRTALHREKHKVHGSGWDTTAARFSSTRRYTPAIPENRDILNSECFDPSGGHHHPHDRHCLRSTVLTLSRKGVKNDRATYALWLKRESIADSTPGTVKSVYRHMIDKGMHPNRFHFTTLMDGFVRAGDVQAAEQVMQSARAAGFEPDVVMWTVLISGYARKGEPRLAMRTFRTMLAAGVSPDIPAIDALAHAYFAVGAYSVARKILLELWPRVKPLPGGLENASLKHLARMFRQSENRGAAPSRSSNPHERHSFKQQLRRIVQEWERKA